MSLSTLDLAVARRETRVPGMAHLLDAERMHGLLSRRLEGIEPGTLRFDYLRYKPGMNCLAAFEITSEGASVRGYAKALRPSDGFKLRKQPRKIVPGERWPGRLVFEERAILVYFRPNDRKLRSLRHVGREGARRRILKRISSERSELAEAGLRQLAYKPERRFVGELHLGDDTLAVLKLYTKAGFARRNSTLDSPASPGVRLPRVLGASARNSFLILEWLRGELLRDVLMAPAFPAAEMSEVGAALAEFHRFDVSGAALACSSATPMPLIRRCSFDK